MTRRDFLTGQVLPASVPEWQHISSAVISVLPRRADEVAGRLAAMEGVEVHARQENKIVVTIEGPGVGALGERLTRITLLDGVITANLVFEHIYSDEGHPP